MALGYCKGCGKLVTIVSSGPAFPNQVDSRRELWFPVEHQREDGTPCNGIRKSL
jgi:hypothetical protein